MEIGRLNGAKLVQLRQSRIPPDTQNVVAAAVGVTQQAISDWERARRGRRVAYSILLALAAYFDVAPAELLHDGLPAQQLPTNEP